LVVSVGAKVTERVLVPTARTVPAGGVYTNVPDTDAMAFNCVELRAVPKDIESGVGHVIFGVCCVVTTICTVAVAVV